MCTLTVLKTPNGFRVFMNRDEALQRPAEIAPGLLDADHDIYGPRDPLGGGTWIAHNARGYWGCLLNGYAEQHPVANPEGYTSRGVILPMILAEDDPIAAAANLAAERFLSFRLVVGSSTELVLYVWDGFTLSRQPFAVEKNGHAWFLTSSSWNQEAVIAARSSLFRDWIGQHDAPFTADAGIPSYHQSSEPNLATAPFMSRANARTKSITDLKIEDMSITMGYQLVEPWQLAEKDTCEIAV